MSAAAPRVRSAGLVPGFAAAATIVGPGCPGPFGDGSRTFTNQLDVFSLGVVVDSTVELSWVSSFDPAPAGATNCVEVSVWLDPIELGLPVTLTAFLTLTLVMPLPAGMTVTGITPVGAGEPPSTTTVGPSDVAVTWSNLALPFVAGSLTPPAVQGFRICGTQTGNIAFPLPTVTYAIAAANIGAWSDTIPFTGGGAIAGPQVC